MQEYSYTDNGSEIVEWIPVGAGCGKSLSACLADAKAKGLTWDESKLPEVDAVAIGQKFVVAQGYGADEKIICLNKLLKIQGEGTMVEHPKLVTTYTWLETVQAMAVAGSIQFPPAPHTFEEVVAE
jgi:hypothetical protein